jgi:micrococcal nuclease
MAAIIVVMLIALLGDGNADASHPTCKVDHVIDGDTFVCDDGAHVRLLQINTPELTECGGDWAKAALGNIFLTPGREVSFDYDAVTEDRYGRHLAAPIVIGTDGNEYNISIVMVYVGLAHAAYYGDNAKYLDWANASETYARVAQWNMWKPDGPFVIGAAACSTSSDPPDGGGCDSSYPDVCIPSPPPDLDCREIAYRRFRVLPPDPHGFDGDHDGLGCES